MGTNVSYHWNGISERLCCAIVSRQARGEPGSVYSTYKGEFARSKCLQCLMLVTPLDAISYTEVELR